MRRRWRPRRMVWLAVVLVFLLSIAGGTGLVYSSVKQQSGQLEAQIATHLQLGQQALEDARASLNQANTSRDEKLISQAQVQFITAQLQFSTARQVADNSSLLRQLESVPSVGELARSRHVTVDALSVMGVDLALAGRQLADLDGQLIAPSASGQQGRTLLTLVDQVQSKIGPLRIELTNAVQAADQVDLTVLSTGQMATLLQVKGVISGALASLDQFQALAPVLTEVLGGNGARSYLIEQVNPAELRAGGGFIGTYSVLRADHGTLSLIASGDGYDLSPRVGPGRPGYIAPPGPIREFIPNTSWSLVDSNFYPDFPTNAQTAETFAQPRVGYHIDGVISIDYYTVAKMLEVTGPLDVPGYRLTLNADNFVRTVVTYDVAASTSPTALAIHKAILTAAAGPLLQRIVTLQPSGWPALISALNDLAASRNLQTYFNNSDVEKTVAQYGWSGAQKAASASDYLMEVESNLGGTKANYFVTRHYTVELTRNGSSLHHKVTVDITDNMPYADRPGEYYRAYIRLYISGTATNGSDNLVPPLYANPPPPAGTKMLDGWMLIHGYGHDKVVVFEWDTPWHPNGRGQEQIYFQKQPGTTNDKIDVTWHDGNGHTYSATGDLGQDRIITLAPSAVTILQGQIGTAQLPVLALS